MNVIVLFSLDLEPTGEQNKYLMTALTVIFFFLNVSLEKDPLNLRFMCSWHYFFTTSNYFSFWHLWGFFLNLLWLEREENDDEYISHGERYLDTTFFVSHTTMAFTWKIDSNAFRNTLHKLNVIGSNDKFTLDNCECQFSKKKKSEEKKKDSTDQSSNIKRI